MEERESKVNTYLLSGQVKKEYCLENKGLEQSVQRKNSQVCSWGKY